jgi:hypothetical protein
MQQMTRAGSTQKPHEQQAIRDSRQTSNFCFILWQLLQVRIAAKMPSIQCANIGSQGAAPGQSHPCFAVATLLLTSILFLIKTKSGSLTQGRKALG